MTVHGDRGRKLHKACDTFQPFPDFQQAVTYERYGPITVIIICKVDAAEIWRWWPRSRPFWR